MPSIALRYQPASETGTALYNTSSAANQRYDIFVFFDESFYL